ncbi:MAG: hypothetical protein QOH21_3018, partial [Acidobacteriota bacterium]|nr:hypothetical protein [Acidobacteriota bacterium]
MHRVLTSIAAGALLSLFLATPAAAQVLKEADQPHAGRPGSGLATYKPDMEEGDYLLRREEHIARLRGYEPGKPFDPTARVRALAQLDAQEAARAPYAILFNTVIPLAYPNWVELGPNPIPNGQTFPTNPVSGRVTAIEIDPTDANKVYVGTAQGGVFRSLNGGSTWTPIFDSAQSLAIGALALDAVNGRLYVGTGEANGSIDSFSGVGLYRIDAVNTTATLVGPINPVRNYNDAGGTARSAAVFTGRSISRILIVPNNPSILFVGTAGGQMGIGGEAPFDGFVPPLGLRGLYRLANVTGTPASVTVTRLAVSTTGPGGCFDTPCTGNRNINDMVFDPGDLTGNTLLVWQNGVNVAGDGGVWRSTNAMAATPAFTQTFITTSNTTSRGRGGLAIYKQGASPAVVYIASGEASSGTSCFDSSVSGAVRVSTDGGVTFGSKFLGGGGFCGGQCFYNIGFAASPGATTVRTDDRLYLAGQYASYDDCSLAAGTSTDGGASFTEVDGPHSDAHVIRVAPSNANVIYRGDDGGIWKSTDAGTSWTSLNNSTFRATQFQSLAVHPTDPNFSIGGTQDNGTSQLLPTALWNRIDYGDGGFALIDQSATNTTNVVMYHTYYNSTNSLVGFARADTVAGAFDGNWQFLGCQGFDANGITCTDRVLFYAPMTVGPGSPNTVYY